MKHVQHALRMLKPDGRLVAIMSPGYESRKAKVAEEFRQLLDCAGEKLRDVEAGTFKESGTDVRTVLVRFDAERLPWFRDAPQLGQTEQMQAMEAAQPDLFEGEVARMRA